MKAVIASVVALPYPKYYFIRNLKAGSHFNICCDNQEIASLGAGFTLYYEFKKAIIWVLLVLSVLLGIPVTLMIGFKLWENYDGSGVTRTISRLSVGNFYEKGQDTEENLAYGDAIMIINCICIFFFLAYSVNIRRSLLKLRL